MKIVLYISFLCMCLFAQEESLPSELNAWKSLSYVNAAKNSAELSNAALVINKASFVGLHNTPKVEYVTRPNKEGGTVSYGGIFQITIKENGIYRVVLGNASWIDLSKNGELIQSVSHKRGAENTGIRKMVDYPLEVGTYTLQISAGGDSTTALLITKIN